MLLRPLAHHDHLSTEIDYTLMFRKCDRFISGAELKEVMAELDEHLSQEEVPYVVRKYILTLGFFQNDEKWVIDR